MAPPPPPAPAGSAPELPAGQPGPAPSAASGTVLDRVARVGSELGEALRALLEALPGAPLRPNQLASTLGVNRAVASKVLGATAKRDPGELLHLVPGPEPLRKLARAAGRRGVEDARVQAAVTAADAFDRLIREEAGTRSALDALLSSSLPGARERFELASKYSVFKGLSQLKGVLAESWLGTAVVWPSADEPLKHDLVWVNGAVGMQRLRPGVTARFGYRHQTGGAPAGAADPPLADIEQLEQFCTNPPARLEARRAGDAVHYTLPDDLLGPKQVVDMFVVDHHPAAMHRYSRGAEHPRNSLFVEPAMPVGTLVFDVLLHEEAFPGSDPQLVVFDTGYDGIANVNDRGRDIDRVDLAERVEVLGGGLLDVRAAEFPTYGPLLAHLAERYGWDSGRFRGYRTRIRYPVYGWQVSLSFAPPPAPGEGTA